MSNAKKVLAVTATIKAHVLEDLKRKQLAKDQKAGEISGIQAASVQA